MELLVGNSRAPKAAETWKTCEIKKTQTPRSKNSRTDPLVEFKTFKIVVCLTSFNPLAVQGVSKEPTPSVLPLPVIHTNSFFGHQGASLQFFSPKELGTKLQTSEFKNSFLIQTPKVAHENSPQELFLFFLLSQTLIWQPQIELPNS